MPHVWSEVELVIFAAVPSSTGLTWPDYATLGLYLLVTAAIVAWASRREKNTEDFFLGGRSMPWLAVGLSIMATLLSSISYLGLPGEIVKNGIAFFAGQLAIFPAMAVTVGLFIPFFMRLRFTSAYEYLENRFDYRARLLGGVLFFLLRLGWVSVVMYSGSLALSVMAGWDLQVVIAVLGVAATLYTCFGGLKAAIWTDVLQAVMLFGGAAVIVVFVWFKTGQGPAEWWAESGRQSTAHARPIWFSFDPFVRVTIFTGFLHGFLWQCCTHCSDQVVLQRYASTPSLSAARKSYITNMLAAFLIAILLGLAGFALLYYYLTHPERLADGMTARSKGDELMPWFYRHELPVGFAGLILANFLCDAMQTLVSGVNSITAVASEDVMERLRPERANNTERLRTARRLTLLLGTICTLFGLGAAKLAKESNLNIVDLMPYFNMFLGPLACLFLIGMFLPRVTGRTALPAILASIAVAMAWVGFRQWMRFAGSLLVSQSPSWMVSETIPFRGETLAAVKLAFHHTFALSLTLSIAAPCAVGVVSALALSTFFDPPQNEGGNRYNWWAVMRRPSVSEPQPQ